MAEYKLKLAKRDVAGKKTKKLRQDGMITSVIYGDKEPILAMSEYVPTEKILEKAGYHSPVDLDLDGKIHLAIVKDVQINPVSRRINNIEFQAIKRNAVVEASAPVVIINFEGSEASKTHHYELTQSIEELSIKAKPADLPEELTVDATNLTELDDKIILSDIKLPAGVELADKELELDQVVASLYDPAAEAAAREAEIEETAEEEAEAGGAEAAAAGPNVETDEKSDSNTTKSE